MRLKLAVTIRTTTHGAISTVSCYVSVFSNVESEVFASKVWAQVETGIDTAIETRQAESRKGFPLRYERASSSQLSGPSE